WLKGRAKNFLAGSGRISLQFSNLRVVKLLKLYLSKNCFEALEWLLDISPNVESLSIESPG
ncbi:hypothetical protein MKW94_030553, partial [Papaver nudicaule]|nr:hypothetical protein [Papaver nudicaule]